MGDRNHGLALHQYVQAVLDGGFDFRIQRRGRFVQHQQRRVLQKHPGNGNALALAAGQFHAAFADLGLVAAPTFAIHQLGDKAVGTRAAHGGNHFGLGRLRTAIQQVLPDRPVQQRGVLGDHADLSAQALLGHAGNILAVDEDAARLQVIQPK